MAEQINQGKVLSIRSSVVDVHFPVVPAIRNVLIAGEKGEYVIEVFTQLDNSTVRGVALTPTQGLARGQIVTDTGKPFCISRRVSGTVPHSQTGKNKPRRLPINGVK